MNRTMAWVDRSRAIRIAIPGLIMVLAAVLLVAASPSDAQQDPPPPIDAQPLTGRHQFTDDISAQLRLKPDGRPRSVVNVADASRLAVLEITVQPGARFPWHTHPGPVLAAVTSGELVYTYADDCVQRPYPAGTAFVDPGDNVHTAYNPTDEPAVVIATFLRAPESGPLTVPVVAEHGAALDLACGFKVTTTASGH